MKENENGGDDGYEKIQGNTDICNNIGDNRRRGILCFILERQPECRCEYQRTCSDGSGGKDIPMT